MSGEWVVYELNGEPHSVRRCICGSKDLRFDAGMMGGVVQCWRCGNRVVHNTILDAIHLWNNSCNGDWRKSLDKPLR